MGLRYALRFSFNLLSPKARRRLILLTGAQSAISILDLAGILLIAIVAAALSAEMAGTQWPTMIRIQEFLGVAEVPASIVITIIAAIAALLLITKSLIGVILARRTLRFLARCQSDISKQLAEGLFKLPYHDTRIFRSQVTAFAVIGGVGQATIVLLGSSMIAVSEGALLIVLGTGLILLNPAVTLFALVFFGLLALILVKVLSGWGGRRGKKSSALDTESMEIVQESLRAYRELAVLGRREHIIDKFSQLRASAAEVQGDILFIGLVSKYIFEIALVIGAVLLVGSQLLFGASSSVVATLALFIAAGSRIVPSILRLQNSITQSKTAAGLATYTYEVAQATGLVRTGATSDEVDFNSAEALSENEVNPQLFKGAPDLVLSEVSYTYPGNPTPAVKDVSIYLKPGGSLALVGGTGAGKSTLADLIIGVALPTTGFIQIGGVSPRALMESRSGLIGYVPQEAAVFNGTIRQNVALGLSDSEIDDSLVWEALERSQLANFLQQSRQGLQTLVGEHGLSLSGGQLQRLGLARALYNRPSLLVLDEATSALDAITEQAISETLETLKESITLVVVAHRLATVQNCDVVAYFENGYCVAQGIFDEVRLKAPGFDLQARLLGL